MSVNAQLEGKEYIDVDEVPYKLDDLIPDITNFKRIHTNSINIERELGRVIKSIYYFFCVFNFIAKGGFGVVYKGILQTSIGSDQSGEVAVKQMILRDDIEAFYDFQHEIIIMGCDIIFKYKQFEPNIEI